MTDKSRRGRAVSSRRRVRKRQVKAHFVAPATRRDDLDGYPGPGARNAYRCKECGRYSVTVHVDQGVTPLFLRCLREGCEGQSVSAMYPPEPWPKGLGEATHEWYRPDAKQMKKLTPGELQHVKQGGLLLREIGAT
jgi:hypothetical protein